MIINLGAGLCTRFWRLGLDGESRIRWLDVDVEEVIELKSDLLSKTERQEGKGRYELMEGDIRDLSLPAALQARVPPSVTHVIWIAEGLLFYYSEESMQTFIREIKSTVPATIDVLFDAPMNTVKVVRRPLQLALGVIDSLGGKFIPLAWRGDPLYQLTRVPFMWGMSSQFFSTACHPINEWLQGFKEAHMNCTKFPLLNEHWDSTQPNESDSVGWTLFCWLQTALNHILQHWRTPFVVAIHYTS